jgi:excisionase family DNA binding protein
METRDLGELPGILTVREVAAFLKIGADATYRLIREKKLTAVKVGRYLRVSRRSLAAFCGVDDGDLATARDRRREEVDTLLARYRAASDEVARCAARLAELGVSLEAPKPQSAIR